MERRVAVIGAGTSGLVACKYILEKGFNPIFFEAEEGIGGVWARTMASTKIQNTKEHYRFSDFPWPESVTDVFPGHTQVMEYLESYARNFGILPYIKFCSKVTGIDYIGESNEEIESWDMWSGTGKPFGSRGKWNIKVEDARSGNIEVYQAEFVVLCIGLYSGLPYIPDFPPNQGPELFDGKVVHSMDYSAMDNQSAAELIEGKRIAVIGSQKSAMDIAAECADANGVRYPCTMIQRTVHWFLPTEKMRGVNIGYMYCNRFAEILIHKPGETFWSSMLATLLSPFRWAISKFIEISIRRTVPLKKYGMIPEHSFIHDVSSCHIGVLTDKFYNKVEEGSIVLKKGQISSFCKEGLLIEGEARPLQTDLVIFATGYKGDQKLRNMFESSLFQKFITGSSTTTVPLYRQIVHPRIPQLAIIGYAESLSNLYATEIRCQWLAHFLDGKFELPCIRDMEKDVLIWENHMKQYADRCRRTCISNIHIWDNDRLCKDMGCNPRRKKGFFAELFQPYGPTDYAGLASK